MENMEALAGFIWGAIGGILPEILLWYRVRDKIGDLSYIPKPLFYWLITGLMICAGGVLVVAYIESGIAFKPILAMNVGASAPLAIGALAAQTPPIHPGGSSN
jgi:hypothetical protein